MAAALPRSPIRRKRVWKGYYRNGYKAADSLLSRADPFAKKDWYDIKAPTTFQVRQVGKTLVTRTTGTKVRC